MALAMHSDSDRKPSASSGIGDTAVALGRWSAVGTLLVAPINKPATSILVGLCLFFSIVGTDATERWRWASRQSVVRGFLAWGAVLIASSLRASDPLAWANSFTLVCSYPLIVASVLQDTRWARRALMAFGLAMLFTTLVSYGMECGLVPQRSIVSIAPNMRNTVFKEYTQQGLATLILGCMALSASVATPSRRQRWLLWMVGLLAAINVAIVLGSRTAHIALIPLVAYWAWRLSAQHRLVVRSSLIAASLVLLMSLALLSPVVQQRVVSSLPDEATRYIQSESPTAAGIRMQLWRRTIELVAEAPVLGHGLDQWRPAYRRLMNSHGDDAAFLAGHPHQEMLLILAEQGGAGLVIYLALLLALVKRIRNLEPPWRDFYLCVAGIYISAGLANCLWGDFTHRHTFVLLAACLPAAMQARPRTRGLA